MLQQVISLGLDTQKKSKINNVCCLDLPDAGVVFMTNDCIDRDRSHCVARTNAPSFKYNCHGLTFASRRTQIDDTAEVEKILVEDNYKLIAQPELLAGDIAIWREPPENGGEIQHSGVVVKVLEHASPLVVSKWGDLHECIHPANYGPYGNYRIEYYRVVP